MITYLLDASALWCLFRIPGALRLGEGHTPAGVFHICELTRTEFLSAATSPAHREELAEDWTHSVCSCRFPRVLGDGSTPPSTN